MKPRSTLALSCRAIIEQVVNARNVHNQVNLFLIGKIPADGLNAIPSGSKDRTVAEQFVHMNRVRWIAYLISHESHHRGSIMLVLKQNALNIPDPVFLQGLWTTWMWENK